MTHKEFRDPLGLTLRMVGSHDRAAWSALKREPLRTLGRPIDRWLMRREERVLMDARPSDQPMLFVVGPPRSGSTFVYQRLAKHLQVSYPTNLSALFPRAPISAQELFGSGARRDDEPAYYGNTRGLGGVNDGFHIWDRWFGPHRYVASNNLSDEDRSECRRFFDAWRSRFPHPFLNKNNRNSECMPALAEILPEARFLVIRRDPIAMMQSLLTARRVIQGDVSRRWGLRSHDSGDDSLLSAVDAVCDQLIEIDERLRIDCAAVAAGSLIETTYEEFCAEPAELVTRAAEQLGVRPDHTGLEPAAARLADTNAPFVSHARASLSPLYDTLARN